MSITRYGQDGSHMWSNSVVRSVNPCQCRALSTSESSNARSDWRENLQAQRIGSRDDILVYLRDEATDREFYILGAATAAALCMFNCVMVLPVVGCCSNDGTLSLSTSFLHLVRIIWGGFSAGTAHISKKSAEDVAALIAKLQPDTVMVRACDVCIK